MTGAFVGSGVGNFVGASLDREVGDWDGCFAGFNVGSPVGLVEASATGLLVGDFVGFFVTGAGVTGAGVTGAGVTGALETGDALSHPQACLKSSLSNERQAKGGINRSSSPILRMSSQVASERPITATTSCGSETRTPGFEIVDAPPSEQM